jgi:high-affinity nickel-transport protein
MLQRRSTALAFALGLPVLAWGLYALLVIPFAHAGGPAAVGLGLGPTAFALGVRHAFDADHIAAIDNTTRKLIDEARAAHSVGLWFAFGHSTVVFAAVALVTGGVSTLVSEVADPASPLAVITGVWGPLVSSVFLLIVGGINLVALTRSLRGGRAGHGGHSGHSNPAPGGLVTRALRRFSGSLDRPWKMYVVGLLFGLGFDTASTVTLLLLAGGSGVALPWFAALVIPVLFAAGMVLCDGLNGIAMAGAHRSTRDGARRAKRYNTILLAVSVTVAFAVAAFELAGVLTDRLGLRLGPAAALGTVDLGYAGVAVVALLASVWAIRSLARGLSTAARVRSRHSVGEHE